MKYLLLLTSFAFFHISALCQSSIVANLGLSIPQGEFAIYSLNGFQKGSAGKGFDMSFQFIKPIKESKFSVNAGLQYTYHPESKGLREEVEKNRRPSDTYELSNNLISSVFVGLNFSQPVSKNFSVFGDLTPTIAVLKMTDLNVVNEDFPGLSFQTTYDPSLSIGFKGGIGVLFKERFELRASYMNLGEFQVNQNWQTNLGVAHTLSPLKRNVSMLLFSAGYRIVLRGES